MASIKIYPARLSWHLPSQTINNYMNIFEDGQYVEIINDGLDPMEFRTEWFDFSSLPSGVTIQSIEIEVSYKFSSGGTATLVGFFSQPFYPNDTDVSDWEAHSTPPTTDFLHKCLDTRSLSLEDWENTRAALVWQRSSSSEPTTIYIDYMAMTVSYTTPSADVSMSNGDQVALSGLKECSVNEVDFSSGSQMLVVSGSPNVFRFYGNEVYSNASLVNESDALLLDGKLASYTSTISDDSKAITIRGLDLSSLPNNIEIVSVSVKARIRELDNGSTKYYGLLLYDNWVLKGSEYQVYGPHPTDLTILSNADTGLSSWTVAQLKSATTLWPTLRIRRYLDTTSNTTWIDSIWLEVVVEYTGASADVSMSSGDQMAVSGVKGSKSTSTISSGDSGTANGFKGLSGACIVSGGDQMAVSGGKGVDLGIVISIGEQSAIVFMKKCSNYLSDSLGANLGAGGFKDSDVYVDLDSGDQVALGSEKGSVDNIVDSVGISIAALSESARFGAVDDSLSGIFAVESLKETSVDVAVVSGDSAVCVAVKATGAGVVLSAGAGMSISVGYNVNGSVIISGGSMIFSEGFKMAQNGINISHMGDWSIQSEKALRIELMDSQGASGSLGSLKNSSAGISESIGSGMSVSGSGSILDTIKISAGDVGSISGDKSGYGMADLSVGIGQGLRSHKGMAVDLGLLSLGSGVSIAGHKRATTTISDSVGCDLRLVYFAGFSVSISNGARVFLTGLKGSEGQSSVSVGYRIVVRFYRDGWFRIKTIKLTGVKRGHALVGEKKDISLVGVKNLKRKVVLKYD